MRRWNRRRASPRSVSGEAEGATNPAGPTVRARTKGRRRGTATVEFALVGTASVPFITVAQDLLGISPIPLSTSTSVALE